MPSAEHETPIALTRLDPGLVAELVVELFGFKMPDHRHAESGPTDIRVLIPRTYHADGLSVYRDENNQPVVAILLEIQRGHVRAKIRMWKLYAAQLELELGCSVAVIVYCPKGGLARWYRNLLVPDGLTSIPLQPRIFGPEDVPLVLDEATAAAKPARAIFAVLGHAEQPDIDAAFPALAAALRAVGADRAVDYYDIVLAGLPVAPRQRWEEYMTTAVKSTYLSKELRERDARARAEGEAQGRAEGEARGEARALLTVLESRHLAVPDAIREQILACTDLAQLDTWLRRAASATTVHDIIRP